MAKKPIERPAPKDKIVNFRVAPDDYELAAAKAKKRGSTVSKIMRALFWMWANDEGVPKGDGWPPEVTEQEIRAQKRKSKAPPPEE